MRQNVQQSTVILLSAIALAKFPNGEIASATEELIKSLDSDLEECGFEAGSTLEKAALELDEAINDYEEANEDLESVVEDAKHAGDTSDDDDADGS